MTAFERPKYGCLNTVNDPREIKSAINYGDTYLVLRGVRMRTTFTDQDSSSSNAKVATCEHYAHVLMLFTDDELHRVLEVATRQKIWHSSENVGTYRSLHDQ